MRSPPELTPLNDNQIDLSDLLENANENYGKYYELRERYLAWQEWYQAQRKIFEEIK
jgi:hypothetical protein